MVRPSPEKSLSRAGEPAGREGVSSGITRVSDHDTQGRRVTSA